MDPHRSKTFPSEKGEMNWSNDNHNSQQPVPPYDPSQWATPPPQDRAGEGALVLVDENGNQVGALGEHINVAGVVPGSHEPVEIDLSRTDGVVTYHVRPSRERPQLRRSHTAPEGVYLQEISEHRQNALTLGRASTGSFDSGKQIPNSIYGCSQKVRPIQADYLRDSQDPAYANSRLVGTAATAARVLVTSATYLSKAVEAGARTFTEKTKPVNTPMTFQPTTHNYVRQLHNYSATGANIASKTVTTVTHHAQNLGAKMAGKGERERGAGGAKPGLINKGLVAFGTIADGIDYASKLILTSGSQAATTVIGHRYGSEAGEVARGLTGVVKNVGLVYVDASGVSRRAVVKSVAKGMVVGRVKGGGEVVFEGNNSSQAVFTQTQPQGQQSYTPQAGYYGGSGRVSPVPPQYNSGRSSPMPGQFSPPPIPQQQQYSPLPQQLQQYPPPPPPQQQHHNTPFKY